MAVWKSVGEKKLYGIGTCFQFCIIFFFFVFRLFSFIFDIRCRIWLCIHDAPKWMYRIPKKQHIFVAVFIRISIGLRIQKKKKHFFFSLRSDQYERSNRVTARKREGEKEKKRKGRQSKIKIIVNSVKMSWLIIYCFCV